MTTQCVVKLRSLNQFLQSLEFAFPVCKRDARIFSPPPSKRLEGGRKQTRHIL